MPREMAEIEHSALRGAVDVIALIKADMADGTLPASVRDFSELHDYVDANCYLIDALYADVELDPSDEILARRDNRVMEIVNVWLAAKK